MDIRFSSYKIKRRIHKGSTLNKLGIREGIWRLFNDPLLRTFGNEPSNSIEKTIAHKIRLNTTRSRG